MFTAPMKSSALRETSVIMAKRASTLSENTPGQFPVGSPPNN
jgi:hypothetical protein